MDLQRDSSDKLPDDINELEKIRVELSRSFIVLRDEIQKYSDELGRYYNTALKQNSSRYYGEDSEIIAKSHKNDELLNQLNDLSNKILTVDMKLKDLKKEISDK